LNPSSSQGGAAADAGSRDRQIAYFTFNFALDMAAHGIPGLKPLECLLMMAINQANIIPLTRDPEARSRYGALEAPAPDDERRPVSVRAVAASMRLPYETARRNIRRLEAKGACIASEAGVVTPAAFMLTPAYFEAARVGHERLHALYRMLTARGLLDPLPAANYDEGEPPVRAAVRLMSDYLLRAAEAVMGRTGDLAATLVLLPLLAAAAGADGRLPEPMSAAALARRTQLPAETVRRHAIALVEQGICVSGPKGLGLADPSMRSPEWRSLLRENAVAAQRMFAGLAERGVVAVWDQMAAQPGASSSG
jgi:predicted ArsR family transcriptional regulator